MNIRARCFCLLCCALFFSQPALAAGSGAQAAASEAPSPAQTGLGEELAQAGPEDPAARAKMRENTAIVQGAMQSLYTELLAMRGQPQFVEFGDSPQNPAGADWKNRVKALRQWIRLDLTIAMEVKDAPGLLLGLAMDKDWRSGVDSDLSQTDQKEIEEAIRWTMEP